MSNREKQMRTPLYFAISLCVLSVIVAVMIAVFMEATRVRINDQNRHYLEDAMSQTVKRVDEIFDNSMKSIKLVSRLYELQLETPEFDHTLLNDMSEPTPFDHIRFVSTDGVSWTGDGSTTDCSDRDYFINGMRGGSGICFYSSSRFTSEPILVFYTPLYFRGEIIGVVNGILESDNLSRQLDSSFFGFNSSACIITRDGAPVAVSWMDSDHDMERSGEFFSEGAIIGVGKDEVFNAIADGGRMSFAYRRKNGEGIACIAPLVYDDFVFVQTFPAGATNAITSRANSDAMKLEIELIGAFLIYVAAVSFYYIRRTQRLSEEKKDLSQIVDSVKGLYRRFVVIDLEEDTYEYLEEGEVPALGLPPKGKYSEWLQVYMEQYEKDPRFWGSMDEMAAEHLRENLTKENWHTSYDYNTADGRWERISLIKLDMQNERTDRILGAVEDITESKIKDRENREALETAFRAAEAASRAKSDFLSRMSHDIRTPMNAIIGLTAIMGTHIDDRDKMIDCLSKVTSSSKHLLGLINEVLDMSKIESGKLVLSENDFTLPSLMSDILSIVQPQINAKHQSFSVHTVDIVHENVKGDNIRLQQVCVNILGNAVKYTPEEGHITMTIAEKPSKSHGMENYVFTFEDDGIGMSPEFLKRVFDPFERADDERVSDTQGTGLGMSIANSIIGLMGGNIAVESTVGKGSKFTVDLTLKLQDTDEESGEQLIGLPVLVADDEKLACETACIMLEELGMKGEWVLTGKEAVESVAAHHRSGEDLFAVILDWKMPGMDGVETARAIRKEVGESVPIIILSAYDWSDIEAEAREAGVNAFIDKPLFKSRLRDVFINILSDKTPERTDVLSAVKEKDYSGKRALLVEDNALNQEIAQEILELTSLSVEVAENGKAALDMFEASESGYYDIVFMDIQMPLMNGYEATRAIRALERDDAKKVPIVAMSANTFSEDIQASLESGMNQHIGKPLGMEQLAAVLEKWLG